MQNEIPKCEAVIDLKRGEDEGWLIPFQRGMRNSNGNPRREKISILLSKIPHEYITCEYNY